MVRNFHPNHLKSTDQYKDTDMSLNLTADGHLICDMQGKISIDKTGQRSRKYECYLKKLKHICRKCSRVRKKQIKSVLLSSMVLSKGTIHTVLFQQVY